MSRKKDFWGNFFTALAIDGIDLAIIFLVPVALVSKGWGWWLMFVATLVQMELAFKYLPQRIAQFGSFANFIELGPVLPANVEQFFPSFTFAVIFNRFFPHVSLEFMSRLHATTETTYKKVERRKRYAKSKKRKSR